MRDIALTGVLGILILISLGRPDVGVLTWTWFSMMNPHRLTYGFAHDFQFALMIAASTAIGLLFYRGEKRIPWTGPVLLLLAFDLWMIATHFAGFHPELVADQAIAIAKIQLMVFVTIMLLHTRSHINWFVGVVAFSIGFYGVKGGIFTLTSGGSHTVWGPESSVLEGNNEIALALTMTIPLIYYCFTIASGKWTKRALIAAMVLCAAAVLGSQSRGAFLALSAMGAVLWWRSETKAISAAIILAVGLVLVSTMPSTWRDRMGTIETYEEDLSAMQRVDVWRMTWRLALDNPVLGGGMGIYTEDLNARYNPTPIGGLRNAHSIYFSVLGEHGFTGLLLFIGIWISVWRSCAQTRRETSASAELKWAYWLASMVQVSLIGYLAGGAFLYLSYADFPYNLLIVSVILRKHLVERRSEGVVTQPTMALATHPRD
jgi:probable O-glycosylation ligase (exosortase A-associated)